VEELLPPAHERKELGTLAQPLRHNLRTAYHLGNDRCNLRRTEIEVAIKVFNRQKNLAVAEVG
jgi:hypothetical protein